MTRIPAGKFRTQFVVQNLTGAKDDAGHCDESDDTNWSTFCERRGAVVPRTSREFREARQVNANIVHMVKLRYDKRTKNITTKMRLKKFGEPRFLNIDGLRNIDEMNHTIELICVERL